MLPAQYVTPCTTQVKNLNREKYEENCRQATSVDNQRTTQRYIPEDSSLQVNYESELRSQFIRA
jgi:hypothetical protein